jgi:ABC-2 type transport system ATP-binding protein
MHVAELSPTPLMMRGVVKRRGRGVLAVDGLDLTLHAAEVTALLGPNGAGKSTTVALLTGRLAPDDGRVTLFGGDPRMAASRARLGVMLQEAGMPRGLTVAEQIDLFRGYYVTPRPAAEVIALAGLNGLERRRCAALSGGQQRRLQFAMAVCGRPDLLILDEPTTGMDIEARHALWTAVRSEAARGAAVLLTTHHLEEAEALADRIVVIDRGRVIADGPPASLKAAAAASAIRCVTALDDTALAALTGVFQVSREGARVVLMTRAAKTTVSELLARDPDLEDLTLSGASLEDAFTRLLADSAATQLSLEKAA